MQRQQCLMWLLTYHFTGPGTAIGRVVFVCVFDDNFLGRLLRVDLIKWVSNVRPSVRPYIRPYVRPQKVSSISMKFGT